MTLFLIGVWWTGARYEKGLDIRVAPSRIKEVTYTGDDGEESLLVSFIDGTSCTCNRIVFEP